MSTIRERLNNARRPMEKEKSVDLSGNTSETSGEMSVRPSTVRRFPFAVKAGKADEPAPLAAAVNETLSADDDRQQAPVSNPAEDSEPVVEKAAAAPATAPAVEEPVDIRPKKGWVSPSYSLSRSVDLDPELLARNRIVGYFAEAPEVDAYRILRTKILQRTGHGEGNTIMITSAVAGEGKTLTAINLALTFAREFRQTVLLVDCDLRQQNIHRYLGYDSDRGLIDYLLNDVPVPELITWPGVEKLTIISGGRAVSGSTELLGSAQMRELVQEMKSRYPERYVIFDVPPVLTGADALAFAPYADHIIVAVEEGKTPLPEVHRAMKMLPKEKVLGMVLNRRKVSKK